MLEGSESWMASPMVGSSPDVVTAGDIRLNTWDLTTGRALAPVDVPCGTHRLRVGEVEVVVADLADVIRSKESAGRPKDLRVLPLLYRHQSTRGDGKG